jgi:hypothetical protein
VLVCTTMPKSSICNENRIEVTLSFGTLFRAVLDTSFLFNVDCLLLEHLQQPVRLADGWCWFVLRDILLADCWWLVCSERKVLLASG